MPSQLIPILSVIIPSTRSSSLKETINSVHRMNLEAIKYEVVVVDNTNNKLIKSTIDALSKEHGNLVYIHESRPGLHYARHSGLRAAKGSIVAYIDDDIEVETDWGENIIKIMQDEKIVLLGGKVLPKYASEPKEWIPCTNSASGSDQLINYYLSLINLGCKKTICSPSYILGCNFITRKKLVIDIGGFHPDGMPWSSRYLRGDGETHLANQLEKMGKVLYSPELVTYHNIPDHRLNFSYFKNRAYMEGITGSYVDWRNHYLSKKSKQNDLIFLLRNLPDLILVKRRVNMYSEVVSRFNKTSDKYLCVRTNNRLNMSYAKGYLTHSLMLLWNKDIRNWVRKELYYD